MPEYYETGSGITAEHAAHPAEAAAVVSAPVAAPPAPSPPGQQSDLARLLTEDMGAQIVSQHAAPPDAVTPAPTDDDDAAAELASADSANGDAGLFDSDPREDEAQ